MVLPRLPGRLRCVLELLPEGGAVADVGAGHGALAVHVAARGRRVIATEAGEGPYRELVANLRRWGARGWVEPRRGEDLTPLRPGEAEGAVIAGMGGHTVLRIAAGAGSLGLCWLALQCVQRAAPVPAWLERQGWRVLAKAVPEERGHAYPTWLVEVGAG